MKEKIKLDLADETKLELPTDFGRSKNENMSFEEHLKICEQMLEYLNSSQGSKQEKNCPVSQAFVIK